MKYLEMFPSFIVFVRNMKKFIAVVKYIDVKFFLFSLFLYIV